MRAGPLIVAAFAIGGLAILSITDSNIMAGAVLFSWNRRHGFHVRDLFALALAVGGLLALLRIGRDG